MIARPALFLALLALLPVGAACADVPANGTFTATSACPALTSIRKDKNPGDVALAPRQAYRIVAANKTPASYYLVVVPAARPERRWVSVDCGSVAGNGETSTPPVATRSGPPNRAPAGPPIHYVLALSWEPGFCAGHDGKPECAAETAGGFDATHFTLHGLWPDPREYCGAPAQAIAADKAGDWRALPAVDLAAATRTHLAEEMPGTQSLLERHEWLKHGTCSGADANTYFGRALGFLDAVNDSPVQRLFAGAVGKALSLDIIRAAFDQAFGAGAGQRLRLSCTRGGGTRRITELTLGLAGDVMGTAPLAALIRGAAPTNGGCDGGLVSAVR